MVILTVNKNIYFNEYLFFIHYTMIKLTININEKMGVYNMGLSNSTNYTFGISTTFVYIALGILIIGGGVYLYTKLKSKNQF